ncbi:MAG: cyclic nucleotide-binding domain-containing protein [Proteobacteria bacterium]|nr:cyclic nucleotide-binding domain-containing protein [Pseudomonadota bacterium]MCP4921390.1 cyclic nucleotide-binding domain-containing protein [Pseudomonadota bacterium]
MQVATHTVSHGARAAGRSTTEATDDVGLGWCAVAHTTVGGSLLDGELGGATSSLVLDTVHSHLRKHAGARDDFQATDAGRERILDILRTAVNIASREVNALRARRGADLNVTLDGVWAVGGEAFIAHVGDGRVYLLRKGLVHKLTQDHVEGDELHDSLPGQARPMVLPRQPLSRALGPATNVETETMTLQLVDSDRLVLTSPWLHRGLDDLAIREAAGDPVPDGVTARLLGTARNNGVDEDVCCALMDVGEVGTEAAGAAQGRLATLARIPLFAYCTERELLAIAGITRPVRYRAGGAVFHQGEPGQGLYLVVQGSLKVEQDGSEIAQIGTGANFGEMSMLDHPQRSATVRALENSELLLITRNAFFELLKRDPTLAVKVLWNMLLRLSANLRVANRQNKPEPPVP